MKGIIQEAKNTFAIGHEQANRRPYLIIYDSQNFILGFPLTTQNKAHKAYPSHKNPLIDNISEVMLDQLQIIPKHNFTNMQNKALDKGEYNEIIELFLTQIIKNKNYAKNANEEIPAFFNIIKFLHNINFLQNFSEYIVLSSQHFNSFSKMCLVAPLIDNEPRLEHLHMIDYAKREAKITGKAKFASKDISNIHNNLISLFAQK